MVGFSDFTIYERADSVGGVWRDNQYPGAACAVPSPIYSFSYALKPDWTVLFGKQSEIRRYLDNVIDEFGLQPHLRLNTDVTAATFDDKAGTWLVELSTGESSHGDRAAQSPEATGSRRYDRFPRTLLPLRPVGPFGRSQRQTSDRCR